MIDQLKESRLDRLEAYESGQRDGHEHYVRGRLHNISQIVTVWFCLWIVEKLVQVVMWNGY